MYTVEIPSKFLSEGTFRVHSGCGWRVEREGIVHNPVQRPSIRPMSSSTLFLKEKSVFMEAAILSQPCITVV